jgi:hypothetical protein
VKIPNAFYSSNGPIGPLVLPGKYEVRLTANGKALKQPLEIRLDPRIQVSPADLQKEFDLAWKVYERTNALHQAVDEIRDAHSELAHLNSRFGTDVRLGPVLLASRNLDSKMSEIEEGLIQVNMKGSEANLAFPNELNEKFDTFIRSVETADGEPTKQQYAEYDELNSQLQKLLAEWRQLQLTDVQAFNSMIEKYRVPFLAFGSRTEGASSGTTASKQR